MLFSLLPFAAAVCCLVLAVLCLLPKKPSLAKWWCFAGMALLGIDSLFMGLGLRANEAFEVLHWLTLGFIVKSAVPAAWLGFSLTYSRGDYHLLPARRIIPIAAVAVLPLVLSMAFRDQLVEIIPAGLEGVAVQLHLQRMGKFLSLTVVLMLVWILMNLEQTFRAAVGTMRWRIKYVVLGLGVIFGARLYVRSQTLLFSGYEIQWSGIESSAILIGSVFLVVAHLRTGFTELEIYPSRAVLRSSLTGFIVGGYLFIVGILARVASYFGGADSLQFQAFILLLGMAGLAVLLLSDRLRQRIHSFVNRHFARAQHDSVRIWTEFSRRLSSVKDQAGLAVASAKLVSETFEVLSVTVWLLDEQKEHFIATASTAPQYGEGGSPLAIASNATAAGLRLKTTPFDLESVNEVWAESFRQSNVTRFPNGGNRWCVPLRAGEEYIGALILADRINGANYTFEQLQLLQCIADQITSVLLNLRLANELARSREFEALQTMSAFFVHDLKNTASSLNMMLKNLPVHFENPAFREDALRAVSNTGRRIDEMIERLTTFRQQPRSKPVEADLNQLVTEAIERLDRMPQVELTRELQPLPKTFADCEQIQSVVTNLVLNARDALGAGGHIRVSTEHLGDRVILSVSDDGCGMSAAFQKDSLFRPFQTTKKKGLGIGMFQSRRIIEAHGGNIQVESETGKGSTFRVSLPVKN